jgi:excinuclease UvrABC nuclease subunit
LLRHFGSLGRVRRATNEELSSVVGPKVARAVIEYFARSV